MASDKKYTLLRSVLRALGLSPEAVDEVVTWITDLLAGETKADKASPQFPYRLNDRFLTPAELRFYEALRPVVSERALLCAKVSLGDLFRVQTDDTSQFRVYTNKIDRKHVDFLLCDPATMRPLVAIELDDRSHQRADRQARDAFVNEVFQSAGLPLLHISVRQDYKISELQTQLAPFLKLTSEPVSPLPAVTPETPACPKCGSPMVLRTAQKGASAGKQFWGCSSYPVCRSMLPCEEPSPAALK